MKVEQFAKKIIKTRVDFDAQNEIDHLARTIIRSAAVIAATIEENAQEISNELRAIRDELRENRFSQPTILAP